MDLKSFILVIFGMLVGFYGLIIGQLVVGLLIIVLIIALWLYLEKVVPRVDQQAKNIQQMAEDTGEIRKLLAATNAELALLKEKIDTGNR